MHARTGYVPASNRMHPVAKRSFPRDLTSPVFRHSLLHPAETTKEYSYSKIGREIREETVERIILGITFVIPDCRSMQIFLYRVVPFLAIPDEVYLHIMLIDELQKALRSLLQAFPCPIEIAVSILYSDSIICAYVYFHIYA